jgi:two-component system, cell cycle sensor histidine kinase and response regulator CckA
MAQQGEHQYAVIIGRDITERRKLNDQLIQAQKMEGIGRLAGGVAHDFNNLLVVIAGGVELARAALAASHPAQIELDAIQEAGERAARLTQQLLTFARRQAGDPQLVDLNALLRAIEPMLRRLLRENIYLSLRLASDPWLVVANQGQIEQVVVNLVVNAQDAMPDGGLLEICTENSSAEQIGGEQLSVTLKVTDSGVGMSDEILSHVFEPFFTTKPLGKGTGLGLATCYGIVTQYGGSIRIISQPVDGTQVLVSFPRASGSAPEQASAPHGTPLPSGSEQVLLVEDEPAVRQLIARVLRGQGYAVYESENGQEALQLVENGTLAQIDLLLTDLVMPVMGGRELAQRLAARLPTLKILFVSGYAADERLSLDSFYAAAFLAKPFSPATLAQKVRELLDG